MPGFETIIDQKRPVKVLKTLLKKKEIPHALLFTGIEGTGRENAALTLAKACNCFGKNPEPSQNNNQFELRQNDQSFPTEPCNTCHSCRRIESDNHPDIIRIKPVGSYIRIDKIRTLCEKLIRKPYEAGMRVVIISDAQALNPSAANALLKLLEEPPDRTILILIAPQIADLLPTIVSRCQNIRFNPISRKNLARLLNKEYGLDQVEADLTAAMSGGSITRALEMNGSNWKQQRDWLLKGSGLDRPAELPEKSAGQLMLFAEKLAQNKNNIPGSLEIFKSWIRDLIIFKFNRDKIINRDLVDKIKGASRGMTIKILIKKIDVIQSAQKDVQYNMNTRMAMEVMMIRLARE